MEVNGIVHRNMQAMGFDCKPGLKKFKKPVLILQGTEDIIPVEVAQRTHDIIPNSELILMEKCAHYGWLEARETYFGAIRRFLESV